MGLVLVSTPLEVLLGFFLLLWILYHHLTKNYKYWEKRGVPYRKPVFPFGSMKDLIMGKTHLGEAYDSVYKEFQGERFCGVIEIHRPILVIRDPDLIKQIMIKDFNHFVDRAPFEFNHRVLISNHLFAMNEEDWRKMRPKLTPAFSSGKMKEMFLLMVKCGEQLSECLNKLSDSQESINVKEILAKFTMDVIATCAFGLEMNSLKDDSAEFYKVGTMIFKPSLKVFINQKMFILFPTICEILNIQTLEGKPRKMLYDMISSTVKYREENNVTRKDFLDILVKLKDNTMEELGKENDVTNVPLQNGNQREGLSLDEMVSQCFIFFAAGFETSSSTATFCLYELAQHPEIQERLTKEIDEVLLRHGGKVTYQALQEMKYMDQVIDETLRMYASLGVLHRRCTKTYRIPGSDLVLEKGQKVYIPAYAIHHDPEYYPEPFKFDPDRFSPDNTKTRHPFVHLPFGDGPRNCIGMRFGLMQTKIGLTTFLSGFRVGVAEDTPIPMKIHPPAFVTLPKKPVFLKVTKR